MYNTAIENILVSLIEYQKLSKANVNALVKDPNSSLYTNSNFNYLIVINHPSKVDTDFIVQTVLNMSMYGRYYVSEIMSKTINILSDKQIKKLLGLDNEVCVWYVRNKKLSSDMIDYVISIERGLMSLVGEQYAKYKNVSEQQLNRIWDILTGRNNSFSKSLTPRNMWFYLKRDYNAFRNYGAVTPYIEATYYKLKLKIDGNGGDIDDD